MKKICVILFFFTQYSFAQNLSSTLTPVEGGTVQKDNTNASGVMTSKTNGSYGYVTFDLGTLPKNATVTDVTLTGFINTLNTPTMGHQAVVVFKDPRKEKILFDEVKNGIPVIDSWTWSYGSVQNTFNARGISEVENNIGTFVTFAFRPEASNQESFNFIAWTNTYYRPNLIVNYQLASSGSTKADFSANKTNIAKGDRVSFKDSSSVKGDSWKWDFDFDKNFNKHFSTIQNPTFVFQDEGDYTISFTATNSVGSSSKIRSNFIHVFDVPSANFGYEINLTQPNTVNFFDSTVHKPQEWFWDFGDGKGTSQEKNPLYIYDTIGDYQVCLISKNIAGADTICRLVHADTNQTTLGFSNIDLKNKINIYPNPVVDFVKIDVENFQTFELFSMDGKKIITFTDGTNNSIFNLKSILPGIYFYKINVENNYYTGRLIKINS